MENSIEAIWQNGFLNEATLVAPRINDLYNRKSIHVVERVKRMFRINQLLIFFMAVLMPLIHYAVDAIWQGIAGSVLLLFTAWYNSRLIRSFKTPEQGSTSLEYLRSFDQWLRSILQKGESIIRFSYPLYLLIAISTLWSAWTKQGMILKMQQRFPGYLFTENIQMTALIITITSVLLMFWFSAKIYRWEIRLMYGRVLGKVQETIAEMEKLKNG